MEQIGYLLPPGAAIWAGIDASNLGARRGRLGGGFLDMGPVAWFFAVWLLWIVAFPCYLFARPRLVAARNAEAYAHQAAYGQVAASPFGRPAPASFGQPAASPQPVPDAARWGHPAPVAPAAPAWGGPATPAPAQDGSRANQLARLEAMRDRGQLTPAEFAAATQEVLGRPSV